MKDVAWAFIAGSLWAIFCLVSFVAFRFAIAYLMFKGGLL